MSPFSTPSLFTNSSIELFPTDSVVDTLTLPYSDDTDVPIDPAVPNAPFDGP